MTALRRRLNASPGFTLVELLIVVLIVGILVAVSAPSFLGQVSKARDSAAQQNLAVNYREAAASRVDNDGSYPIESAAPGDPLLELNGLIDYLNASEPELHAIAGSDYRDAAGGPDDQIVVDSSRSDASDYVAYVQSGSGTIYCLIAPTDGPQRTSAVGSADCPAIDSTSDGYALTVGIGGSGSGAVTSDVSGTDGQPLVCPAVGCKESFSGPVQLTASADSGSAFLGWAGACTGTAPTCDVAMDDVRTVVAIFAPTQEDATCTSSCAPYPGAGTGGLADPSGDTTPDGLLSVATLGSGRGWVTSYGDDVDCGQTCVGDFPVGASLLLSAQAAKGSTFVGWSDENGDPLADCPASGDCVLSIPDQGVTFVVATFSSSSGSSGGGGPTPTPPVNTDPPLISNGSGHSPAQPIDFIIGGQGSWDNAPYGYDYTWQRSADGTTWQDIPEDVVNYEVQPANIPFYWVQLADAGTELRLKVVAHNADGTGTAYSNVLDGGAVVDPLSPCGSPSGSHDDLANALPLRESGDSVTASNVGATSQSGEPHYVWSPRLGDVDSAATNTVWFCWTAPDSGIYQIDTFGSQLNGGANDDTVLAAFLLGNPSGPVAMTNLSSFNDSQDDEYSDATFAGELTLPAGYPADAAHSHASAQAIQAILGRTYYIQVAGWQGTSTYSGTVHLNVTKLEHAPVPVLSNIPPYLSPSASDPFDGSAPQTCQVIKAVSGSWRYDDANFSYQWQSSTDGVTWQDYTPAPADLQGGRDDPWGLAEQTITAGFPAAYAGQQVRAIVTATNVNGSVAVATNAATLGNGC